MIGQEACQWLERKIEGGVLEHSLVTSCDEKAIMKRWGTMQGMSKHC